MSEYLVLLDADRIHDYVFATGRLKEIRGGSLIVRRMFEDDLRELASFDSPSRAARLISASGGVLKAVFSSREEAEKYIREARKKYRLSTQCATITGCCVEYDGDFARAIAEGERQLRLRKNARREYTRLPASGLFRFCDSCGCRPAAWSGRNDGRYDGKWLCRSCQMKREAANTAGGPARRGGFLEKFMERMGSESGPWKEARQADEIGDLGEASRPAGYIGFVYCDANRMGERLKGIRDEESYRDFCEKVNKAGIDAVVECLRELYPQPRDGLIPFDVVMYGGDDLILICTAEQAVRFANAYCLRFQEKTKRLLGDEFGNKKGISVSAGVVIAHAAYPVLGLYNLSLQLLRSAKKLSYEILGSEGKEVSTLDFQVVTTPSMLSLEKVRGEDYIKRDVSGERILTAKPYLCGQAPGIEGLLNGIANLKKSGFPRNKLSAMYETLFRLPRAQATLELLLIRSRLNEEARQALNDFLGQMGMTSSFPWLIKGNRKYTPLTDMIELYGYA